MGKICRHLAPFILALSIALSLTVAVVVLLAPNPVQLEERALDPSRKGRPSAEILFHLAIGWNRLLEGESSGVARLLLELAVYHARTGQVKQAQNEYLKAIKINEQNLTNATKFKADYLALALDQSCLTMLKYSELLANQNDNAGAEKMLVEAMALQQRDNQGSVYVKAALFRALAQCPSRRYHHKSPQECLLFAQQLEDTKIRQNLLWLSNEESVYRENSDRARYLRSCNSLVRAYERKVESILHSEGSPIEAERLLANAISTELPALQGPTAEHLSFAPCAFAFIGTLRSNAGDYHGAARSYRQAMELLAREHPVSRELMAFYKDDYEDALRHSTDTRQQTNQCHSHP